MKYKSQKVAYWFFGLCMLFVLIADHLRLHHGLCQNWFMTAYMILFLSIQPEPFTLTY